MDSISECQDYDQSKAETSLPAPHNTTYCFSGDIQMFVFPLIKRRQKEVPFWLILSYKENARNCVVLVCVCE